MSQSQVFVKHDGKHKVDSLFVCSQQERRTSIPHLREHRIIKIDFRRIQWLKKQKPFKTSIETAMADVDKSKIVIFHLLLTFYKWLVELFAVEKGRVGE